MIKPPEGWRFDAFADVRMGKSLFQMDAEDWLVPAPVDRNPEGGNEVPSRSDESAVGEAEAPCTDQGGDA